MLGPARNDLTTLALREECTCFRQLLSLQVLEVELCTGIGITQCIMVLQGDLVFPAKIGQASSVDLSRAPLLECRLNLIIISQCGA